MTLSEKNVRDIAHLARLTIENQHIPHYTRELSNILNLVAQMNKVDTANIEPMAHAIATTQPMRDDIITETNQRDYFQKIAPLVESGLYLVPQVIE